MIEETSPPDLGGFNIVAVPDASEEALRAVLDCGGISDFGLVSCTWNEMLERVHRPNAWAIGSWTQDNWRALCFSRFAVLSELDPGPPFAVEWMDWDDTSYWIWLCLPGRYTVQAAVRNERLRNLFVQTGAMINGRRLDRSISEPTGLLDI